MTDIARLLPRADELNLTRRLPGVLKWKGGAGGVAAVARWYNAASGRVNPIEGLAVWPGLQQAS